MLKEIKPVSNDRMKWMNETINEETYDIRAQEIMKTINVNISIQNMNDKVIENITKQQMDKQKTTYNEAKEMVIRSIVNSFMKNDLKMYKEKLNNVNIKNIEE